MLREIPLTDSKGEGFTYALPDSGQERVHWIDKNAAGTIEMPDNVTHRQSRDRYIVNSLIEEAIRSSQIEGAVTTRVQAKEMIKSGRRPTDRHEQMILNNFRTMQRIREVKDPELTRDLVFELHHMVTHEALDDPSAVGRFRLADERVRVEDGYGDVFYLPPPADQLEARLAAMCDFANGKTPDHFIHPAVRAIILHFWLAYDHPFVDGNGRCARALFYWSMLRSGYWLCEYLSISNVIFKAPTQYYRSFLYAETDGNDLTYFVLYHLDVIQKAVQQLHKYLNRKAEQLHSLEKHLRRMGELNHRQRELITHALRHPDARYSIRSHWLSHGVVYQTARTDLLDLVGRGFLVMRKQGRTMYFYPADQLEGRLSELATPS